MSDYIFAFSNLGTICFRNVSLIEETRASRIPSCNRHGNRYFACLFLHSVKC